jgi:Aspartyl/Asparaginyl beta-hydroxylase
MKHFTKIAGGIEVADALRQIDNLPHLWGADAERTDAAGSPHAQSRDIWLRFRPREELTSPERFSEPHFAAFYPAWRAIPALHPIVFDLMRRCRASYLGGIMLTRLPAGAQILPHHDDGWHAAFMNVKVYVILRANDRCFNWCMNDRLVMRPGEAWRFDNHVTHGVDNFGDTERIALISTMRVED